MRTTVANYAFAVSILFGACNASSSPDDTGTVGDAGAMSDVDAAITIGDGSVQQLCVDTINQYRATIGLGPLMRWTDNESCVDGEAAADMGTGKAHGAYGTCLPGAGAQNECPGWPLPLEQSILQCLKMMWDEGPGEPYSQHGHYINMTNTTYTKVACGFAISADGKTFWAAQDFQ